jgi:hypothetical protein
MLPSGKKGSDAMFSRRSLSSLFTSSRRRAASTRSGKSSVNLRMEALDERVNPVTSDYSAFAGTFPRHAGSTVLYLNFDGWSGQNVSSFQSTTGNRSQDIQEILYRTAEIFSPFDVQVERMSGDGAMSTVNGNSTIFIGDDSDNNTATSNSINAYTPANNTDMPGSALGQRHVPNSNSYDWAFVDPVSSAVLQSNLGIVQAIAHEAGHTFGLGHIRTVGVDNLNDNTTLPAFLGTNPPEMMSYDSPNVLFMNQTFNLTAANFSLTSGVTYVPSVLPKWADVVIIGIPISSTTMQTQNSFTYLQNVLGSPPFGDDYADVADSTSVAQASGIMPGVVIGPTTLGSIERLGDYDVFQFTPTSNQTLTVNAQRVPGNSVDPVLMIFEGSTLLAINDNRTAADFSSRISWSFQSGHTYRIVVGASDSATTGNYLFWVNYPTAIGSINPDHSGPRVLSSQLQGSTVAHPLPTRFLVTFNEDVDPSTFSVADVRFVNPAGTTFAPSSLTDMGGTYHRQWRVGIPSTLPQDSYTLRIGPSLADFAGNLMNQDNDNVNGEATQDRYTRSFTYFDNDDPPDPEPGPGQSPYAQAPSGGDSGGSSSDAPLGARPVSDALMQSVRSVQVRLASEQENHYLHKRRGVHGSKLLNGLSADIPGVWLDRM